MKKSAAVIVTAALAFSSLVTVGSIASTPVAQAVTSSAGGSGGGGSGGSGHFTGWKAWFGSGAFNSFQKWSGASDSKVKDVASGISISICNKSQAVWAVYGNMAWKNLDNYNFRDTVKRIPVSSPRGDDFKEAGRDAKMPSDLYNDLYKKYDTKDNVWLVCAEGHGSETSSGSQPASRDVTSVVGSGKTDSKSTSTVATYSKTGLYSTSVDVDPQINGNPLTPMHAQTGDATYTGFAAVYNKVANAIKFGNFISKDIIEADSQSAASAEASSTDDTLMSLDQDNIDALAAGGVMNVYNRARYATIKATTTTTTTVVTAAEDTFSSKQHQVQTCSGEQKRDWLWKTWDWGEWYSTGPVTCTPWVNSGDPTVSGLIKKGTIISTSVSQANTNSVSTPAEMTLSTTGFWQILSVHCNQAGFTALINAISGANNVSTGDDSKKISASSYSKKYSSVPAHLDFGDTTNPNSAAAASGKVGFFDKECPYDCTASSTSTGSTLATTDNSALSNVGQKNKSTATNYGAIDTNNNVNSNVFKFFRDNLGHELTSDIWYPKTGGVVQYAGEAAVTTTVTRWSKGTPSISESLASVVAKRSPADSSGIKIFVPGSTGTPATQRNWDTSTYGSTSTAILNGQYKTIQVAAQWASENDFPEVFNLKWEYAPNVSTKFPATNIGFKHDGSQETGDVEGGLVATVPIEGKCYGQYGTTVGLDTNTMFNQNTGTGTTNNLDGDLISTPPNPAESNNSNLVVRFVRATTE